MGSDNGANMGAQMNDSEEEQLFSHSWDVSNISKFPGAHEKKRPLFHTPRCHNAPQNALILPRAFPVSAAAMGT